MRRRVQVVLVSIPQSGFGAFEPVYPVSAAASLVLFQSLSRDSGRLNYKTRV